MKNDTENLLRNRCRYQTSFSQFFFFKYKMTIYLLSCFYLSTDSVLLNIIKAMKHANEPAIKRPWYFLRCGWVDLMPTPSSMVELSGRRSTPATMAETTAIPPIDPMIIPVSNVNASTTYCVRHITYIGPSLARVPCSWDLSRRGRLTNYKAAETQTL